MRNILEWFKEPENMSVNSITPRAAEFYNCFEAEKKHLKHLHYYSPVLLDGNISFVEIDMNKDNFQLPVYQAVVEGEKIDLRRIDL